MDSLTQLTLGMAICEATLGKKLGRKAAAWGAALGTFPDLDVFIPLGDPVSDFTYHRSFTHSIFVLTALTPVIARGILHVHTDLKPRQLYLAVWLVFMTHILIDSFTVYGTQVFWPITSYPVSIGSVFIIDPSYTLPLLAGSLCYLLLRKRPWAYHANLIGLAVSSSYLIWSLGAQAMVRSDAKSALKANNLPYESILVTPSPFNTLLWRIVSVDSEGYYVGYISLLDGVVRMQPEFYRQDYALRTDLENNRAASRLQWFSHGFSGIEIRGDDLVVTDLRMGVEPDYVFQFVVARQEHGKWVEIDPEIVSTRPDLGRLALVWDRIFDVSVDITP